MRENALSTRLHTSATTWQLVTALMARIPLLGSWFTWLLSGTPRPKSTEAEYSGNPNDYLDRFVNAVNAFSHWPAFGVNWVQGVVKKQGLEKAIESITRVLVEDSMGYQKTKSFHKADKKEIADHLLANEKYMRAARKHWGKFAV